MIHSFFAVIGGFIGILLVMLSALIGLIIVALCATKGVIRLVKWLFDVKPTKKEKED